MRLKTRQNLKFLTLTALSAAVLCILSPFSFPALAIPVTLSLFAVFLISAIFPPKISLCAVAVYVLIGALGLPVFSGFTGGFGVFLGPTGGFIIGYLPSSLLVSFLSNGSAKRGKLPWLSASMLSGLAVCYLFGSTWLGIITKTGFFNAVAVTASTCIIPDLIKIFLAALISFEVKKRLGNKEIKND